MSKTKLNNYGDVTGFVKPVMQLNDNDFQNVDNCDLVSKYKISSTKIVSFLT